MTALRPLPGGADSTASGPAGTQLRLADAAGHARPPSNRPGYQSPSGSRLKGPVLVAPQLATSAAWAARTPSWSASRTPEQRLSRPTPCGSI